MHRNAFQINGQEVDPAEYALKSSRLCRELQDENAALTARCKRLAAYALHLESHTRYATNDPRRAEWFIDWLRDDIGIQPGDLPGDALEGGE